MSGGMEYQEQIDAIPEGNFVILHAMGFGVVAAGPVLDARSAAVPRGAGTISPLNDKEFHRHVAWFADLCKHPLPL